MTGSTCAAWPEDRGPAAGLPSRSPPAAGSGRRLRPPGCQAPAPAATQPPALRSVGAPSRRRSRPPALPATGAPGHRRSRPPALPAAAQPHCAVAQHGDRQRDPYRVGEQQPLDALRVRHRGAPHGQHQVAGLEPGPGGRTAGDDLDQPQAAALAGLLGDRRGQRGGHADHPQVGPAHPALGQQRGDDPPGGGIHRDGEAEADPGYRGVDADDPAGRIRQRPAGVAGVQCGVGLDHVLDHPPGAAAAGGQRPAERADHAGGHRPGQAQRAADRDHQLTNNEPVGVTQGGSRWRSAPGPDHREIRQRIDANHVERLLRAVREPDGPARRTADHVRVREQEAIVGEHHAGPAALAYRAGPADRGPHPDARHVPGHLRGDGADDAGVRVQRLRAGWRRQPREIRRHDHHRLAVSAPRHINAPQCHTYTVA